MLYPDQCSKTWKKHFFYPLFLYIWYCTKCKRSPVFQYINMKMLFIWNTSAVSWVVTIHYSKVLQFYNNFIVCICAHFDNHSQDFHWDFGIGVNKCMILSYKESSVPSPRKWLRHTVFCLSIHWSILLSICLSNRKFPQLTTNRKFPQLTTTAFIFSKLLHKRTSRLWPCDLDLDAVSMDYWNWEHSVSQTQICFSMCMSHLRGFIQ